jgi:hypothetical protein
MKTKILALTIVLILAVTSVSSIAPALETCGEELVVVDDSEVVELTKLIKDSDNWVNELDADIDDIVRFKISITYHDSDGPSGPAYMLRDIVILDTLPVGLEYVGDATTEEYLVDGNIITWDLGSFYLNNSNPTFTLEFDAQVVDYGTLVNHVNVHALEKCISVPRYVNTTATVIVDEDIICKSIDVEPDGNIEFACNDNFDPTDGYESYNDPDDSSFAVISVDGDNDGKIDHFIDPDMDELHIIRPKKYWDPDDNILVDISIIDVDYDGTKEWVYDSDGDGKKDRYYDKDDEQIHPYDVFDLTILVEGSGSIDIEPYGFIFLEDFEVDLTATPDEGYIFEKWSGDVPAGIEEDKYITITMDEDKTITAHFKNEVVNGPTVKILKPKERRVYKNNIPILILPKSMDSRIIGPITVRVLARSDKGIDKVEFWLDDDLKHTDDRGILNRYSWRWIWKPKDDKTDYVITVIAFDKEGNNNSVQINVTRVKYSLFKQHPLIAIGIIGGFLSLIRNRDGGRNLLIPFPIWNRDKDEPEDNATDDGDDKSDDNSDSDTYDPPKETAKEKDDNLEQEDEEETDFDWFWYIVTGLALALLAIIAILFVGRKLYE